MLVVLVVACTGTGRSSPSPAPIVGGGIGTTTTATLAVAPTTTTATTVAEVVPTLLVVGDWGSGSAEMSLVAAQMEEYAETSDVEAILTTGDNFYEDDYQRMLEPYRWAASSGIEFWVTWGNHDVESPTRVAAVNQAFDNPARFASIAWGGADILILDSNSVGSEEQTSFIESEMGVNERPTIVSFHHPAYSCSSHGSSDEIRFGWLPMFDDDVVLVLSGHDHNYQHFAEEGVTYLVSGGGGQRLSQLETCEAGHPQSLAGAAAFHFLAISQGPDSLMIDAIGIDGARIDSFAIELEPGG